jgi:ribosomal protein L12E/L44/L45/RPP1/RPP2
MPCLELKIAEKPHPQPSTRLRALLDRPNTAVLRRNHIAEVEGSDLTELRHRIRMTAVLAVDITNPPQSAPASQETSSGDDEEILRAEEDANEEQGKESEFADSFAAGVEIWIAMEDGAIRVLVDADEIPGALLLFDAYSRLAKYQPAYLRLDQRRVGISYTFREGLTISVEGDAKQFHEETAGFFDSVSAIAEIDDVRENRFVVRLPNAGIAYFQGLLRAASEWLSENSYQSILGS